MLNVILFFLSSFVGDKCHCNTSTNNDVVSSESLMRTKQAKKIVVVKTPKSLLLNYYLLKVTSIQFNSIQLNSIEFN